MTKVPDRVAGFDPAATRDGTLAHGRRLLAETSGPEAPLDARILLEAATGLDRHALLRDGDQPIGGVAARRYAELIGRRRGGEPVWRILGEREFWGLPFAISPDVLDPRPDTETLVSAGLEMLGPARARSVNVLDLGTGSGAILVALLHELQHARGAGVDRSEAACRMARSNADRHGLGDRAAFLVGDWSAALASNGFDLVVSNPPYIETAVIPTLAREVRDHDPVAALDGGSDGLSCYRTVVADLPHLLRDGGCALLEVGVGQSTDVLALMRAAGLVDLGTRQDLGGRERVVVGRKAPAIAR